MARLVPDEWLNLETGFPKTAHQRLLVGNQIR
jgi:hypothetical protein